MLPPVLIALAVAAALGAVWLGARRSGVAVLAALWLAYALYEYLMYRRVLCSGECNIRVDLLLLYPALLLASAVVLGRLAVAAFRARRRGRLRG